MIVQKKVIYIFLLISMFMHFGCASYNSKINNSRDIRNVSALEWRLGKKQEADDMLHSRQQVMQLRYSENNELIRKNKELDREIARKQEIIKNLTYSIEKYYHDIESNIDVQDNIDRIDGSLKQIILQATSIVPYINKGKLLYRIHQVKSMRRKIALLRKGAREC